MEITLAKKNAEICKQILLRFGDGEFLKDICNGRDGYPDQSNFWRWRQADKNLAEDYKQALIQNVETLLQESETLIRAATTRDEVIKADKMLNHYRWKAEKLIPVLKAESKSSVELKGAIGSYTIAWADDSKDVGDANEPAFDGRQTQGSRANLNQKQVN